MRQIEYAKRMKRFRTKKILEGIQIGLIIVIILAIVGLANTYLGLY